MKKTGTESIKDKTQDEMNAEPVIEIYNLKKSFGSQEVLSNVSMKLYNGENLVVLGKIRFRKIGSGKVYYRSVNRL